MSWYANNLRHPKWQKKRLEVMERDNFACRFCGDDESFLNVHHDYYERGCKPWEYPSFTLYTLCESCHLLVTNTACSKLELKAILFSRYCFGTMLHEGVEYLFRKHGLAAL